MISNPARSTLLSSIGWVDGDSLWRFDTEAETTAVVPLQTGARYASLHSAGSARFAVAHHFGGARFEVSVRSFAEPREVLSRAAIEEGRIAVSGDPGAWADVPRLYAEYLAFAPWKDFVLLEVSPSAGTITVRRFEWYDDSYDKDYQGVLGVLELPEGGGALVSVQRSSRLILHDPQTGRQRRSIDLGGRGGNPRLELGDSGREVWASDFDTLVVVETGTWRVLRSSRLQGADAGTRQFIGDFSFAPDREICVVARPFGGDVVGVDRRTLKIRSSAKLGRQPLEVAALPQGEVVARDWKTGDLLRGTLKRRWFAR